MDGTLDDQLSASAGGLGAAHNEAVSSVRSTTVIGCLLAVASYGVAQEQRAVGVASIEGRYEVGVKAVRAMERAGVSGWCVGGSRVYGIRALVKDRERAIDALRADAAEHGYSLQIWPYYRAPKTGPF